MAARSSGRSGRYQEQARLDALLKFGPLRSSLREQIQQAHQTYGQTVAAGRSTARLTQGAAANAEPQISRIYAGADAAQKAGVTLVNQQLAALPGVADQFKANQAAEVQTQLNNQGEARARDLAMLSQEKVAAQAGAQANQQQAHTALLQQLRQIFGKAQSASEEQGAFASAEAGKLEGEGADREQRERASERATAATEGGTAQREAASKRSAAAKGGAYVGGVKQRSAGEQGKAAEKFSTIRSLAKSIFREGHSRGQAVSILSEEEPATSKNVSEHDKEGKPTGKSRSVHLAARPAYAPDALMAAALDEAQFGGVTPNTIRRLHSQGYSVSALGLKPVSRQSSQVQGGLGRVIGGAVRGIQGVKL